MKNIPLTKHPAYKKLITILEKNESEERYLPEIEISGLTYNLYDPLLKTLSIKLDKGIISFKRDDPELRKYLDNALLIKISETKLTDLLKLIHDYGFEKNERADGIGEYSVKGDVLTLWPPGLKHPIRISYFDGEFESANVFDEVYGKSYENIDYFLIGDLSKVETKSLLDFIEIINYQKTPLNSILVFGGDIFDNYISGSFVNFDFAYPQLYFNRLDLLHHDIKRRRELGYKIEIFSRHPNNIPKNLQKYITLDDSIESGYESSELKILVLSDKELFGTVFLSSEAGRLSSERARKILANLEGEIEIGDYIVHSEHGIGIYEGIKQESYTKEILIGVGEKITKTFSEDYILIKYAEEDELYVPLRQIDKLTKYISVDDEDPKLTRLGKTDWEAIRARTKEDIFAMAKELVSHYAKRELAKAPKIETKSQENYEEFVARFNYKETPDQERTEREIFSDLMQEKPMNRLIVGDVGFGKTEVAMRAAYKVVESGKQVCVLCPTTVLTAQHEKVFADRFKDTKVRIASMSRLNKANEKPKLNDLEEGKIDIMIGTHRLLSSDINFKNLGLIIVDEEQKFGVKQKEHLKQFEYGVHVLSMSATPIPRSLSMALSSIQDISIIQTPPENRKAVRNIVAKVEDSKIKKAIIEELQRNGQIYYLYNRVETILSKAAKIRKLVPEAKLVIAHGQMNPNDLNKNVEAFYKGEFDILLCTTIIENGLDMPNVNTIIIENAQRFGLGQLYQLRGRVGRSEKQAYAYFFYDGEDIDIDDTQHELFIENAGEIKKIREKRKYKKRLQAIKEANELGSGFKLASRDLEIRGAGNLLGKQQHGNIKQIGYALYMQMLAEEIEKLKNG